MNKRDVTKELKQVADLEAKLKELKETIEEKQNPQMEVGSIVRLSQCADTKHNLRLIVQTGNEIRAIILYGMGKGTAGGCYDSVEQLNQSATYTFVAKDLKEYIKDN